MKCLITAGPSYEPLDEVRRITNFSTGELGCLLANKLYSSDNEVILLLGVQATFRKTNRNIKIIEFTTTDSLKNILIQLKQNGENFDAIFHVAALSDYKVGKIFVENNTDKLTEVKSRKIPTSFGKLLVELVPTEKIIPLLRTYFPSAFIVGWKYEADGTTQTAILAGKKQIQENNTDLCIVNGPAYGIGFGILYKDGSLIHSTDKKKLVRKLDEILKQSKLL